jgi:hypothetical protein
MFSMEASLDILRLRESRIAVLKRLVTFALSLLGGLRVKAAEGRSVLSYVPKAGRIRRWLGVALFLARRIGEGALDAPRKPWPARRRPAVEREAVERDDAELWLGRARQSETQLERYLDMPFGEAVGRICKGLGFKPDWAAWAGEPWVQEELRTRPPTSPYADFAGAPPGEMARELPPPPVSRATHRPRPSLHPEPRRSPPPGPPLNRKARRAQRARRRAAQARAPCAGLAL